MLRNGFCGRRCCSFSIRSARNASWSLAPQRIEFDLLFRWFVGLSIDEKVFDASTFSKNRDRLLTQEIAQEFLSSLLALPEVKRLLSADHFSVDGTLLKAWASMKSFQPKDGSGAPPSPGRNGEADFRKTKRSNETHASTTDKDAPLFKKAEGQESRLAYLGHALMENRNGLVVAAEATMATGTAEREAAAAFSERLPEGATLGADKNYDAEAFVEGLKGRGHASRARRERACSSRASSHPQAARARAIAPSAEHSHVASEENASILQPSVIPAEGFDALAAQSPDEARPHVKKLAGRPIQFRGFISPGVEEAPAIVEGTPPFPFGNIERLLMV